MEHSPVSDTPLFTDGEVRVMVEELGRIRFKMERLQAHMEHETQGSVVYYNLAVEFDRWQKDLWLTVEMLAWAGWCPVCRSRQCPQHNDPRQEMPF